MLKSFLTATAVAALLGFGATAAVAQQSTPALQAPAIQKPVAVESGKAAPVQNKAMQNKAGATTAAKPVDSKTKRNAAAVCTTIKDKAAHDACMTSHTKNQSVKSPADQKAATPDKSKSAPRVGG